MKVNLRSPLILKFLGLYFGCCRYIPGVSRAIYDTLLTITEHSKSKRRKYGEEHDELFQKVSSHEITEATLKQKLTQHVDQVCS